jgi:glycosyltransferase involved in cell wall biosynthesis
MARSARCYQRIFANSQFTEGLLRGVGVASERLDLLVGGVDNARFEAIVPDRSLRERWAIPEDRVLLVTVCRLVRKKGVDFLIGAMPTLFERFPKLHLLVVGSGRQRNKLRRQAARSSAAERITFAGRVEHDDIESAYAAADAFVLASRVQVDRVTGLRDAETMGRVLCEANAAGLPVIAARSGGIPSVVTHGENGLLFEPDDVESLATQLRRVIDEPEFMSDLTRRGRELASTKFDWSFVVEAHEERFAQCLRSAP